MLPRIYNEGKHNITANNKIYKYTQHQWSIFLLFILKKKPVENNIIIFICGFIMNRKILCMNNGHKCLLSPFLFCIYSRTRRSKGVEWILF